MGTTDQEFADALPLGTVVGAYRLTRVIGQGGFGITYEAVSAAGVTQRRVAIKEFFPRGHAYRVGTQIRLSGSLDRDAWLSVERRFEAEALKLVDAFDHPAIVKGENFVREHGSSFLVMEYVEGPSLAQWRARQAAPVDEALIRTVMEPVLDAVDYLHARGEMHRDISPHNILVRLERRGRPVLEPVLIDFGAAAGGLDLERQSSVVVANAGYAPIEQLRPGVGAQGAYTDVFALGGVLYYCVAGKPPASAEARAAALSLGQMDESLCAPAHSDAGLGFSDRFLDGIVCALSIRPLERPQSIPHLRAALGWSETENTAKWRLDEPIPGEKPAVSGFIHQIGQLAEQATQARHRPANGKLPASQIKNALGARRPARAPSGDGSPIARMPPVARSAQDPEGGRAPQLQLELLGSRPDRSHLATRYTGSVVWLSLGACVAITLAALIWGGLYWGERKMSQASETKSNHATTTSGNDSIDSILNNILQIYNHNVDLRRAVYQLKSDICNQPGALRAIQILITENENRFATKIGDLFLAKCSSDIPVAYWLMQAHYYMSNFNRSIEIANKFEKLEPNDPYWPAWRSYNLSKMNRPSEAADAFVKSINSWPNPATVSGDDYWTAATNLRLAKRYCEAAVLLERYIGYDPSKRKSQQLTNAISESRQQGSCPAPP